MEWHHALPRATSWRLVYPERVPQDAEPRVAPDVGGRSTAAWQLGVFYFERSTNLFSTATIDPWHEPDRHDLIEFRSSRRNPKPPSTRFAQARRRIQADAQGALQRRQEDRTGVFNLLFRV
jgi:hypothetical protein